MSNTHGRTPRDAKVPHVLRPGAREPHKVCAVAPACVQAKKRPAPPPVYRPRPAHARPPAVQPKLFAPRCAPAAPPVYRPKQTQVAQPKVAPRARPSTIPSRTPHAPAGVLQTKTVSTAQAFARRVAVNAVTP